VPEVFGEPQICNLTGLRVDDCPIMPTLVVGSTIAPPIMIGENSAKAGWRRSADSPLLCPCSLLTGNFAKSCLLARQRI
jgi:hypothetical protein